MFIRSKQVKGCTYFQIVEGYRDDAGRVRHRNIIGLGQWPTIEDAIAARKRSITRIRRELTRLRTIWNNAGEMPRYFAVKVERLQKRLTQHQEKIDRLQAVGQLMALAGARAAPPTTQDERDGVLASAIDAIAEATGLTPWQVLALDLPGGHARIAKLPAAEIRKLLSLG